MITAIEYIPVMGMMSLNIDVFSGAGIQHFFEIISVPLTYLQPLLPEPKERIFGWLHKIGVGLILDDFKFTVIVKSSSLVAIAVAVAVFAPHIT